MAAAAEKEPELSGSNSDGEEEEDEYVVEAILKHRTSRKGTIEYYLKWKGFDQSENTWEPAENLNCAELIDAYQKELEEKKKKSTSGSGKSSSTITSKDKDTKAKTNGIDTDKKKKKPTEDSSVPAKKKKKIDKRTLTGFDKGLVAEEILGATETCGEVHFLIKWKGVNDAELVASKLANVKIPQMVIAFYEARLTWSTSNKGAEETEEEGASENKTETDEKPTAMAVDN